MIGMDPEAERRAASEQSYVRILALVAGLLAVLPTLLNWAFAPPGQRYLGIQTNLDDHMVYAAWMRQAMEGQFFFDNRFAIDAQPTLTVHLYFLVLGWLAKLVGIPLAMAISRVVLSYAFVLLLYRLVRKVCPDVYTTKLAMALTVFGGGIGFAVWHTFGRDIVRPSVDALSGLMLRRLPTDVWQPEGFVFPSMLTNGLFLAGLCLIVIAFLSMLSARDSWQHVPHGALAMFLLMNIHSYDVLIVALAMAGFLVASLAARQATIAWIARALVIGLGAVPSALWFLYVLQNDAVFRARAETLTYSPNFRQVVFGYLGLMALGMAAVGLGSSGVSFVGVRRKSSVLLVAALALSGFVAASSHLADGYFVGLAAWLVAAVVVLAALALAADESPAWNLIAAWATMGTLAIYFPALYQRKLTMGLAIPWAILAAIAVGAIARRLDRSARNLSLVLAIVLLSASSLRWLVREVELGKLDVSNTTVHGLYLGQDAQRILQLLTARTGKTVVLAMPGVRNPRVGEDGKVVPDEFLAPYLPDLNPVLVGLAGVYAYAGHWSETPDYERRRNEATRFFLADTSDEERAAVLQRTGADMIVAPVQESFPAIALADVRSLGNVIYEGPQFRLIEIR